MKDHVILPRELTDQMTEAIAFEARCCGGIAYDIYEAIVAAAPEYDAWISVQDKLPEEGQTVIVWDGEDSLHAKYENGKFYQDVSWCGVDYGNIDNEISSDWVTHWMPAPIAPKPPTEEE